MYYDEEQNNKNPDIGENPSSPQEPEANPAEASAVSPQEAPASDAPFEESQAESVSEADAPADPYQGMSEKEYKANIKRMKQEYKQFQKDKKQSAKAERGAMYTAAQPQHTASMRKGIGAGTSFVLSLLASFLVFVVIFGLLAFFPSKEKSFLASLYSDSGTSSTGETKNPTGNEVQIGDTTVSKGDNVTINVTGDSEIAQAVYAKAANSVVGIAVSQVGGSKWNQYETVVSMGSGIVYSADGIIVTNCHVVENAIDASGKGINSNYAIRVYFKTDLSEWAYATELIGYDATNDITVLRVDAQNLQPIEFADSDTLTTGETAITIGSPGGLTYMNSISEGILSGLNRTVTTDNTTVYDLIQTTAAINPGNSGGALLNLDGELIGINTAKLSSTDVEGMGYAIPISKAEPILEELMNRETRDKVEDSSKVGYMGVKAADLTTEAIQMYNMPAGAFITEVTEGGAADNAGIKKGDIIVKLDGQKVSGKDDLVDKLQYYEAGETIEVVISRANSGEYKEQTVEVTLGSKPSSDK